MPFMPADGKKTMFLPPIKMVNLGVDPMAGASARGTRCICTEKIEQGPQQQLEKLLVEAVKV